MVQILIRHTNISITDLQPVNKDFYWYDSEKHKMLKLNGGNLVFKHRYDHELKKMRYLPETVDFMEKTKITKSSINSFKDFVKTETKFDIREYSNDSEGITLEVEDVELEDFISELERKKFIFEIIA